MAVQSIDLIADYHAHIYFDGAEQRHVAQALRDEIAQRFDVFVSRLVDRRIGPHPVPMFEIAFDPSMFSTIVPWLMLNRRGLSVLVHPNTGSAKDDHLVNALWLGPQQELIVGPLL
jgi:aromatic ring-cleaving dioxygenase